MDWLYNFPFDISINYKAIDSTVRGWSIRYDGFFSVIKNFLQGLVININKLLDFLPWSILILLVIIISWRLSGKIRKGILYGALLSLIGAVGLWGLMIETLSIILCDYFINLRLPYWNPTIY